MKRKVFFFKPIKQKIPFKYVSILDIKNQYKKRAEFEIEYTPRWDEPPQPDGLHGCPDSGSCPVCLAMDGDFMFDQGYADET